MPPLRSPARAMPGGRRLCGTAAALVACAAAFGPSAASAGAVAVTPSAAEHRLLPPPGACGGTGDDHAAPRRVQERTMRCLINETRQRAGRSTVTGNRSLARGARRKNAAMIRHGVFSHTPDGRAFGSMLRESGYRGRSMGENIAWGMSEVGSPRAILAAWLRSPEHRRNLLRASWRDQGIALRDNIRFQGYRGVALWTSEFGRP